jgi:hypothetical protein
LRGSSTEDEGKTPGFTAAEVPERLTRETEWVYSDGRKSMYLMRVSITEISSTFTVQGTSLSSERKAK